MLGQVSRLRSYLYFSVTSWLQPSRPASPGESRAKSGDAGCEILPWAQQPPNVGTSPGSGVGARAALLVHRNA